MRFTGIEQYFDGIAYEFDDEFCGYTYIKFSNDQKYIDSSFKVGSKAYIEQLELIKQHTGKNYF